MPFGEQSGNDLRRLGNNILRHIEKPQQDLGTPDNHNCDQYDHNDLQLGPVISGTERRQSRKPRSACSPRLLVEFGDFITQRLVQVSLRQSVRFR